MYYTALLTHDVVVLHRFIIRSSDTVVKPGYTDLFEGCAFFLYGGYFIIALPVLPPCVLFYKPTGLIEKDFLRDTDHPPRRLTLSVLHGSHRYLPL